MKTLFCLLSISAFIIFTSCRAQDVMLSYGEFKSMIEKKEIDQVIFYRGTNMVKIVHDGEERTYEHDMELYEGKAITRALSKAGIIYKTRKPSSD